MFLYIVHICNIFHLKLCWYFVCQVFLSFFFYFLTFIAQEITWIYHQCSLCLRPPDHPHKCSFSSEILSTQCRIFSNYKHESCQYLEATLIQQQWGKKKENQKKKKALYKGSEVFVVGSDDCVCVCVCVSGRIVLELSSSVWCNTARSSQGASRARPRLVIVPPHVDINTSSQPVMCTIRHWTPDFWGVPLAAELAARSHAVRNFHVLQQRAGGKYGKFQLVGSRWWRERHFVFQSVGVC